MAISRTPQTILSQFNQSTPFDGLNQQIANELNPKPIPTPAEWAKQTFPDITLTSNQHEFLKAISEHSKVAVRSCHDSGKSFGAAIVAGWWLATHPIGTARVITTAPTQMQVKGILWVEINQLKAMANNTTNLAAQTTTGTNNNPLPGRTNQTEWWLGSYLAGVGRKPSDYNPTAFQGLHARYMLIIIDEASGVPTQIIEAVETLATNQHAKILMIGNPDDPTSMFAAIHANPASYGYHTIKIAAWDTPNFTSEHEHLPAALTESLLSPNWVEQRRTRWGVDHPFWQSKVEAEFPQIDQASIIKLSDLITARVPFNERDQSHNRETSQSAEITTSITLANTQPCLGVDVAGSEAGDETVIRLIVAPNTPTTEWRLRSSDANVVAQKIVEVAIITKPLQIIIDSIGVGFGIVGLVKTLLAIALGNPADQAASMASGMPEIIGFNAAESANNHKTYGNSRAELWWHARELFAKHAIDMSRAENRDELEAQLVAPRYYITKGRIFVESKADLKKRIGRSPDNADAFLMALLSNMHSRVITIAPTPQMRLVDRHATSTLVLRGGINSSRLVRQR